jgi:hypothetical protein
MVHPAGGSANPGKGRVAEANVDPTRLVQTSLSYTPEKA